jgi:beta-lactamase regulating signal transducer with metallopeptidase domain
MILYIVSVALILFACLVFYKILLHKETFFRLNRFMLLACLVLAFTLPLIHVPQQWSFRKAGTVITPAYFLPREALSNQPSPSAVLNSQSSILKSSNLQKEKSIFRDLSLVDVLIWVYWIGVAIFGINFIVQLLTLIYRSYSMPVIQDGRFRIVELSGDQAPCSFGNSIFINPEKYEWETYSQILLHEKIHIEQGHSYDILLAEIALVFQWFNPFAWLYRKAVEDNLEFLTDNELLEHKEVDRSSYQLSLVKVSAPHFPVSLTTNYNQSILKKRLIMMNAKKSNLNTTWKYLFIVPILVVFVCFLNEPNAYGTQNKFTGAKVLREIPAFDSEGTWFATIKNDKIHMRFEKGQMGENSNSTTFNLDEFKNLPRDRDGTFELTREAGTILFNGNFKGNIGMGTFKFNPDNTFLAFLKQEGVNADEEDGNVFFAINLKRSYITMLKKQGYKDLTKDELIPLAALKIDEPFIHSIKSNGFPDVSLEDLIPLKSLNVNGDYIKEIRDAGYKNLTVSQVITLKAQHITGDFIKSSKDAGQPTSLNTTVSIKSKPAAPAKAVKADQDDDHDLPSLENVIAMKAMNIDPDFIKGFKDIGYKVDDDDIIAMKSLGVTPEYVKSMQAAGFGTIPSDEIISMKALGVTADDIMGFRKLGYNNIKIDDVISAKAVGVTPAYISSMMKKGYKFGSLDKYIEAKAVTGYN